MGPATFLHLRSSALNETVAKSPRELRSGKKSTSPSHFSEHRHVLVRSSDGFFYLAAYHYFLNAPNRIPLLSIGDRFKRVQDLFHYAIDVLLHLLADPPPIILMFSIRFDRFESAVRHLFLVVDVPE